MELDIHLSRLDFYHFLTERSYDAVLKRVSLAVGLLAIAGALGVIALRGWQQGWALLPLGAMFLAWNPWLLYSRAGKMYRASQGMRQLHYKFDSHGMVIAPPGGRPRTVAWTEVIGTCYGGKLLAVYKDAGHVYLLPRKQLPENAEPFLRERTKTLTTPPVEAGT